MPTLLRTFTYLLLIGGCALWAQEDASETVIPDIMESGDNADTSDERVALEQMARFTLALEQIHRLHASSGNAVSYEELIDGAISGMMGKLDRYSNYLEGSSLERLQEQTQGSFVGIGVVINQGNRFIRVVSPVEGSPSWDAGIAAGDLIISVDGDSMRDLPMDQVVSRLKGEPGTEVLVGIRRPAQRRNFEVKLVRRLIENRSVGTYELLEDKIAYIRVKTFGQDTAQLLRKEMTGLVKKDVEGLVLDLRGNPGGLLGAAVDVANLFLPKETLVVFTQGNEPESRKDYMTRSRPHRLNPKLIVLVNEGSASASEVVSGALQDHDRARLVGSKTFGKASVQSILPIPGGSALKLTTAMYYTPEAREIHEKGLNPDVEVSLPMHRWLRLRNRPAENWKWEEDPQLNRAVELLREELNIEKPEEADPEHASVGD